MKKNKMAAEKKLTALEFNDSGCLVEPKLTAADVIEFRQHMEMTQEEFAERFGISLWTLRSWEQNRALPVITQARLQFFNELFDNKAQLVESAGIGQQLEAA